MFLALGIILTLGFVSNRGFRLSPNPEVSISGFRQILTLGFVKILTLNFFQNLTLYEFILLLF